MRWTRISPRESGGIAVLELEGVMALSNEDTLVKAVTRLLDNGARKIILSFEKLPHLDSGGLGEVMRAYTACARHDGALALAYVNPRIGHLFEITKLTELIVAYDSEASAAAALGQ
jgi:anti-sigma B factor antagonist